MYLEFIFIILHYNIIFIRTIFFFDCSKKYIRNNVGVPSNHVITCGYSIWRTVNTLTKKLIGYSEKSLYAEYAHLRSTLVTLKRHYKNDFNTLKSRDTNNT